MGSKTANKQERQWEKKSARETDQNRFAKKAQILARACMKNKKAV